MPNQPTVTTTPSDPARPVAPRYLEPSRFTRGFNRVMMGFTRLGVSVRGSRILIVRGRSSGELRRVPVNLLDFEGAQYLVAPRGQTQWVRNVRAAGGGALQLGRRVTEFRADELDDAVKPALLREYLRRWKAEVGVFFDGVDASATDEQLLAIAPGYPVFRIG